MSSDMCKVSADIGVNVQFGINDRRQTQHPLHRSCLNGFYRVPLEPTFTKGSRKAPFFVVSLFFRSIWGFISSCLD